MIPSSTCHPHYLRISVLIFKLELIHKRFLLNICSPLMKNQTFYSNVSQKPISHYSDWKMIFEPKTSVSKNVTETFIEVTVIIKMRCKMMSNFLLYIIFIISYSYEKEHRLKTFRHTTLFFQE